MLLEQGDNGLGQFPRSKIVRGRIDEITRQLDPVENRSESIQVDGLVNGKTAGLAFVFR